MKKVIIAVFALFIVITICGICPVEAKTKVKIMTVGEKGKLPNGKWKSKNKKVAVVKGKKIVAKSGGATVIKCGKKKLKVVVIAPSEKNITIATNEGKAISTKGISARMMKWKSYDEDIVVVDKQGKLKGKSSGSTFVSGSYQGKSIRIPICVVNGLDEQDSDAESILLDKTKKKNQKEENLPSSESTTEEVKQVEEPIVTPTTEQPVVEVPSKVTTVKVGDITFDISDVEKEYVIEKPVDWADNKWNYIGTNGIRSQYYRTGTWEEKEIEIKADKLLDISKLSVVVNNGVNLDFDDEKDVHNAFFGTDYILCRGLVAPNWKDRIAHVSYNYSPNNNRLLIRIDAQINTGSVPIKVMYDGSIIAETLVTVKTVGEYAKKNDFKYKSVVESAWATMPENVTIKDKMDILIPYVYKNFEYESYDCIDGALTVYWAAMDLGLKARLAITSGFQYDCVSRCCAGHTCPNFFLDGKWYGTLSVQGHNANWDSSKSFIDEVKFKSNDDK